MNSKKVNVLFLFIILTHLATEVILVVFRSYIKLDMVGNYLISQGIVVVPALMVLLISKEKLVAFLRFRKIKVGSLLMVVLFAVLTGPTITLVNLLSQLFVENVIGEMSPTIVQMPWWGTFFFVAVLAPFCEETVCRGIFYQGYKRNGGRFAAMLLSALLFACLHMNFNQASYAFAMGILAVLLVEATGSIWAAIFYHLLINGQSVAMLYLLRQHLDPEMLSAQNTEAVTGNAEVMMISISVFLILAAITLPLSICVVAWMGKHEGREENLRLLWWERKIKKERLITVPLLIALVLCFTYMILGLLATLAPVT